LALTLAFEALAGAFGGAAFAAALAGAFSAGLEDAAVAAGLAGVFTGALVATFTGGFAATGALAAAFAGGLAATGALAATFTAGLAATLLVLEEGAAVFVALGLEEGTGAFLTAVVGAFVLDLVDVVTLALGATLVGLATVFLAAGAGLAFFAVVFLAGVLAFWAVFLSDMINPLKENANAP